MADVVKKHSISSELAQKTVNAAVAKARELGVTENVAILGCATPVPRSTVNDAREQRFVGPFREASGRTDQQSE
jgi:hypothetical protein